MSTQTQSAPSTTGMEMRLVMEAAEKGRLHDGKDSNDLAARTASGLAYATAARGWPAEDLGGRPVTAAAIAAALGDARSEGRSWRCRCPVHHGTSLSLTNGRGGRLLVKCWHGCHSTAILTELEKRGLLTKWQEAPSETIEERVQREAAEERRRQRRIALARDIWRSSHPATATSQVPKYLASRSIAMTIPPSIRVHGALGPYGRHPSGERRPQMIALVQHAELGAVAVSRTFLTIDGSGKAALDPVRMFCGPVAGGAVRLAPAAERLAITEGVETGLAFMLGSGLATWSALSAVGIRNLILPEVVRDIVIAADPDPVGTVAARAAARRWRAEGRRVVIACPSGTDRDFNDLLMMI